jgi:uncharacterized protein (UPF0303 family)
MGEFDGLLLDLERQENELQFDAFTNETAWEVGNMLFRAAKEKGLAVTLDITRNSHQLFHYAFSGTSPDNDRWIKGKIKAATLMGHSSYYCEMFFKNRGMTMEQDFHLDHHEYLPYGGCFPVIIKGVGMVGTITASGLPSEEDHHLVTGVIRQYLKK